MVQCSGWKGKLFFVEIEERPQQQTIKIQATKEFNLLCSQCESCTRDT
jgi:hypothetical protein